MRRMKRIAMIAGLGMMTLTAVYAQQNNTELERTVVVENQYLLGPSINLMAIPRLAHSIAFIS